MKRRVLLFAPALMLILACSVTSYGWLEAGHMAVAYVAYQKLTPQTRARVDALVRLNPMYNDWLTRLPADTPADQKNVRLFMLASIWADDIKKNNSGYRDDGKLRPNGTVNANIPPDDGTGGQNLGYSNRLRRRYWHFIDLPFSPDDTEFPKDPPSPNAETQIALFRSVLASNSPDDLKSFDLVWLLHIVGDVHQPLHCTARFTQSKRDGDDGGNGVMVGSDSLHYFWDALPGATTDIGKAIEYAQGLSPASASAANNLNVRQWIEQSFKLAKSKVYKDPIGIGAGPYTVTADYLNDAQELAKKQVALAGARMAKILNNELR